MQTLLKLYLRRLTNLTGSNRSLLLRRLVAGHFLDLWDANYLYPNTSAFGVIEGLIARRQAPLSPLADPRDESVNTISRRIRQLQRTTRFIVEERGAQDLYIGWPFIMGSFSDGTPVRCPLLFFPVDIVEEGAEWRLVQRPELPVTLNKSFLLAYAHYNQHKIPEKLFEKNFSEWDADSRLFRTKLYKLFKEPPLALQFTETFFADQLQPFENLSAAALQAAIKPGELQVQQQAVLGIFPQAGSYIVPDYNFLIDQQPFDSLEDLMQQRMQAQLPNPTEALHPMVALGRQVKEESLNTPFEMDASQETAIRAVKAGASLVVQGPPGTGKSQLIANLIADFIAKGKRVLLVSQKKAALDVVHQRLESKGVTDFVALVHDFRWDRKKIYEQLSSQIDRVGEYRNNNYGLDTIQLERRFQQLSRRAEQIKDELAAFKEALFDDSECGVSPKELYLTTEKDAPWLDLKQSFRYYPFSEGRADDFVRRFRQYMHLSALFRRGNHPWLERKSFAGLGPADQQQMLTYLQQIQAFRQQLSQQLSSHLRHDITYETAEYLLLREPEMEKLLEMLSNPAVYANVQHMLGMRRASIDGAWLQQLEKQLMVCWEGDGPELSLPTEKLIPFQEVLLERREAQRNLVKFLQWKYFTPQNGEIMAVMQANGLSNRSEDVQLLMRKLDNRLNLEHNLSQLREAEWLQDIPAPRQKLDFQQWFRLQRKSLKALEQLWGIRNFDHYFNLRKLTYAELKEGVEEMLKLLGSIKQKREEWQQYLSPVQIEKLLGSESKARQMMASLEEDFDLIAEFDRLREALPDPELQLMEKVVVESPPGSGEEQIVAYFLNSLRMTWISHLEAKYPQLRAPSTGQLQQLEQELQACLQEKAQLSQEILHMRVREQTYQQLEYNRLNNQVTYRDLRHQVSKKRKIWPIRKLLAQHGDEVFRLLPCWMASPEAVSAVFPMEPLFDLVIFDEASQCFVEKGLPAVYRGRQVLISGDSKQLQPNDLYQVRWEDGQEEDQPDTEVESLLDLAQRYLPQVQLMGHYRSRSPELIYFSNKHFYKHTLELVPDRRRMNAGEPAIRFFKTEGVWEEQQNRQEAAEVVKLVLGLISNEKQKESLSGDGVPWYEPQTIGVVTFNARQQGLIQDMLEETAARQGVRLPDSLFVKNIENVQGDERDIIVFSVGYAPDARGRMLMQFGSLSQAGGENRLNVAVTRARETIYVVSSIWPEQLEVADAKHEGPKLFREYLAFAKRVSEGGFWPQPRQLPRQKLQWLLKERIVQTLDHPEYQVGERQPFADLTAMHHHKYLGLLLTDDLHYYHAQTLKESHVYQYKLLEGANWPWQRFYSRDFWLHRQKFLEKVSRFLNHLDA
ncbi:AAA domain-containing protein [Cesiribacter andamanensis]|uniref:Putative DNA helicase n=1 Tax=Cesiribacter andamanensis AMV16 TaxID=1279009 RepID=M7NRI1_9BACT|nr:AAA domain-containing protein [Cesiribacter andamanensis]EMR04285.1 putative DNA helicase [Cesiribacter andamanensis AMV16]